MNKPADIGGKRLVSLSPNNWAQWLTQSPEVTVKEMIDSDVLELPIVQEIMRWDMAVLRESPWYQQILQEGEQIGEKRGEQRGEQRGEAKLVLRLLNRRFGTLNESLEQQIRELSVEQLETLADDLLDFSTIAQLETWLEQHQE